MRYYLALQPRVGYALGPQRSVWLDGVLSRDRYDPGSGVSGQDRRLIADEEVTFGQLAARYEQRLSGGDSWQAGVGYSWLAQGNPDPNRWRRMGEQDRFVNAAYRIGLGGTDWAEGSVELRTQELTYTIDAPDYEEDATVGMVGARYEALFGAYQGGMRLNLARYDSTGRLARKMLLDARLHLARAFGRVHADLGWNAIAERFTEPNPDIDNVRLKQTLRSWTLDLIWPVLKTISMAVQLRRDDRSANVAAARYRNEALSLSVIYVY